MSILRKTSSSRQKRAPLTATVAAATLTGAPLYAPLPAAVSAVSALHTGGGSVHTARITATPTAGAPWLQVCRALTARRLCGRGLSATAVLCRCQRQEALPRAAPWADGL